MQTSAPQPDFLAAAKDLYALAERVARLNPAAGEIGAGMLAQLVDHARRALGKAGSADHIEEEDPLTTAAPALLTALRHLADAISRDPGAVAMRLQEARDVIDVATGG